MNIEARRDVVAAAQALADGQIRFVDGVRRVAAMRSAVSPHDHDPDFLLFVAIDSESDHLPGNEARGHCSQAWLEQCDEEAGELEALYGPGVREACAVLITRFASDLGSDLG